MEIRILLDFTKTISRLAGNPFGEAIYNKQVKDKIDFKNMNVIVIPENIEDIAISFVQGFTKQIFEIIDKAEFAKHFRIDGNEKIVNKFNKSVYF